MSQVKEARSKDFPSAASLMNHAKLLSRKRSNLAPVVSCLAKKTNCVTHPTDSQAKRMWSRHT